MLYYSDNFVEAISQTDFCRLAVLFYIIVALMLECSMQLILEWSRFNRDLGSNRDLEQLLYHVF